MILLDVAFCPPVSYFAAIAEEFALSSGRASPFVPAMVYIEACENYQKQSYRNRCRIYAAGGVESISFPVVHEGGTSSLPIRSIRVDYSVPWLVRMERAVVSAYRSSAWFDYYRDEFFGILNRRPETLFELDMELLRFFLKKTGIVAELRLTEEFTRRDDGRYGRDLRGEIHPKRPNALLSGLGIEKPYWQVFAAKHGFKADLSIMDLLFNEGPDALPYLKNLSRG